MNRYKAAIVLMALLRGQRLDLDGVPRVGIVDNRLVFGGVRGDRREDVDLNLDLPMNWFLRVCESIPDENMVGMAFGADSVTSD